MKKLSLDEIVEDHTESQLGHEEIYAVIAGHATFTVDGEAVDAPAGTLVYLDDPAQQRSAVAWEANTTVLAIGGVPGKQEISPWEYFFPALPHLRDDDYDSARRILEEALTELDAPALHYTKRVISCKVLAWHAASTSHSTTCMPSSSAGSQSERTQMKERLRARSSPRRSTRPIRMHARSRSCWTTSRVHSSEP